MWIKLCGIKEVETARLAADLGADAIGLNFYARSPRAVSISHAAEIVQAIDGRLESVGLFVNHAIEDVVATLDSCQLGAAQLHGDETLEFIAELSERRPDVRIIRAFRIGDEGCGEMAIALDELWSRGVALRACLIDAKVSGAYGGTGHAAPWSLLRREYRRNDWPPMLLAGGLVPENVASAIAIATPWGVDVSSGIESAPGVKDPGRMKAFVEAVRSAPPSTANQSSSGHS